MKVSVVIASYNYGHLVAEAIRSVQEQTVSDLEIIVIDDGSTDDTPQVLAAIDDPRLRARRVPNGGESVARNTALEMARGEFIAFLDADDRWRPTKLERQLAIMESEPEVGLVFTDFVRFNGDYVYPQTQFDLTPDLLALPSRPSTRGRGCVIQSDTFGSLVGLSQFPAWPSTVMVRSSMVQGVQFPPGVRLCADLHYMLRVYPRVGAAYIAEPMAELRRHGSNSYSGLGEISTAALAVLQQFAREPMTEAHRAALQLRIGREWAGLGYFHFHSGNPREAMRASLRALGYPGSRFRAFKRLALLPARRMLANPDNVDWRVKQTVDVS